MFAELSYNVAHADAGGIAFAIVVAGALAALCLWRGSVNFFRVRLIEDTPTSKTRSAPQGYVELEGYARPMDGVPTLAPLSGLPCCWYRFTIEEEIVTEERGRRHRRWQTVGKGASTDTFWLEDNTGRVAVDPEGAEVEVKHKDSWTSASGFSLATNLSAHTASFMNNFIAARRSNANPHRFTEWRINRNDPLYAIGLLKNVGSHASMPGVDEDVSALLREWKKDQPQLKARFDLNRDGEFDQREWMLARAAARREVMKTRQEQIDTFADGINLMGPTKDRTRPYILSAYRQSELLKRYRWTLLGCLIGFFALGSAAVWLLNTRFV